MFDDLDVEEVSILFQGLKCLIESNSGVDFHNKDQGHPYYRAAADGEKMAGPGPDPDSPENNSLFNMLSSLCDRLEREGREGYVWWYDFREWRNFCRFAVEAYDRAQTSRA